MKNRWKRLAVIFGAAMLVVCQNGVIQVKAEETQVMEESPLKEEAGDERKIFQKPEDDILKSEAEKIESTGNDGVEIQGTETGKLKTEDGGENFFQKAEEDAMMDEKEDFGEGEANDAEGSASDELNSEIKGAEGDDVLGAEKKEDETSAEKEAGSMKDKGKDTEKQNINLENIQIESRETKVAEGLGWTTEGVAFFSNPNEENVRFRVYLFKDEECIYVAEPYPAGNNLYATNLMDFFDGPGVYTFKVKTYAIGGNLDHDLSSGAVSEESNSYQIKQGTDKLPEPVIKTCNRKEGIICEPMDNKYFSYFIAELYVATSSYAPVYNGNITDYATETINKFDEKIEEVGTGYDYYVRVRAISNFPGECDNSEWSSEYMLYHKGTGNNNPNSGHSQDNKDDSAKPGSRASSNSLDDSSTAVVIEEWKPTTPDELKRYAAYGKEKVSYTADAKNTYGVTIQNAMQGKMCFNSFEAVLGDWRIGRTYNILPSGRLAYKMDSKARITLSIPQTLQAADREFKMICVTEKGQPIILDDLDSSAGTITFETDTFYAFALVYRDTATSK